MSKLADLDRHLFDALDRLAAATSAEEIAAEVARSDAIVGLSDQIMEGAKVKLMAAKVFAEHGDKVLPMLPQIGSSK